MIETEKIADLQTKKGTQKSSQKRIKHAKAKPLHRLKNSKPTKKDEFRKNKQTGHPAYIYALIGHNYKFLGLTHTLPKGVKYEIIDNPNPKDKVKQIYVLTDFEVGNSGQFSKVYENWKLSKTSKKKLKPYLK